jgi:hypothetical protein
MAGAWHTWQLIEYLRAKAGIADTSVPVNKNKTKTKSKVMVVNFLLFIADNIDVMVRY